MVYYRKYRPQLISELDLSSVREKLTSILLSKEIPHAFLFTGSKGLGKTSSARILAKAVNCEKRTTNKSQLTTNKDKKLELSSQKLYVDSAEPCNTCSACITITNGSAVDVLEIDAASNRGIDEIRDLRERIKFSPSSLKTKIYIIDEVHMLTNEAFNALLKTLEEPPSHVMFVLATTETQKLPETIMSRVFQVTFEKPSALELARSLERIVKGENLELEDGVLPKIGELSDGAFRDGAKILEELSLQSNGKKITHELLEKLYKTGSTDDLSQKLIDYSIQKNTKNALEIIQQLSSSNSDFKLITEKVASLLHAKLLESVSKNKTSDTASLQKFLELIDEAYKGLRGAVLPQLPLELAVIEYCIGDENMVSTAPQVAISKPEAKSHPQVEQKPQPQVAQAPQSSDIEVFKKLLDAVNLENKLLAGLLRGSKLEVTTDKAVVHAQSIFHLGKLSEEKNKQLISQKLDSIMGKTVAIEIKS